MPKKTKILVSRLEQDPAPERFVFRGHVFLDGELYICGDDNRLAAVLNTFRRRVNCTSEIVATQEALEGYKKYCDTLGLPIDRSAVHAFNVPSDEIEVVQPQKQVEEEPPVVEDEPVVVEEEPITEGEPDVDPLEGWDDEPEVINDVEVDPKVTRENAIRTALSQLDHLDNEHWTSTGLPRVDVVEEMTGLNLSRREITKVDRAFKRQ